MPYIIDGNNLIGVEGKEALNNEESRIILINLLKNFQRQKNTSLIVVFDGSGENFLHQIDQNGKFRVLFPSIGHSADDCIKDLLKKFTNMKDVTVVTSDRELKDYCRSAGAKIINSIEFYHLLKQKAFIIHKSNEEKKRIHIELSEQEVEAWLKVFQKK